MLVGVLSSNVYGTVPHLMWRRTRCSESSQSKGEMVIRRLISSQSMLELCRWMEASSVLLTLAGMVVGFVLSSNVYGPPHSTFPSAGALWAELAGK
jgi:hypothetical protein